MAHIMLIIRSMMTKMNSICPGSLIFAFSSWNHIDVEPWVMYSWETSFLCRKSGKNHIFGKIAKVTGCKEMGFWEMEEEFG